MQQLRRTIVTKRNAKFNNKKLLIINNKIDINLCYKYKRFYKAF